LNTTGTVSFGTTDSGATGRSVTSTTALANNTWYHVVGEADGANLLIFINGVQEATATAGTGSFRATNLTTGLPMSIRGVTGVTDVLFDETCCYLGVALPVARALAHYQAGASLGFRGGDLGGLSHIRAGQVLDAVTNDAPRNIRVGARSLLPTYQHGQDPLGELKKCALVEMPNGTVFIAKDGTVTLLDAAHRTVSPWNTAQIAFKDDTTGVYYEDLVVDFSDSFLVNEWNASVAGGTLVTSSDAASISKYGKRSQTLSDLPLAGAVGPSTITAALLTKYKDPLMRAQQIEVNCSDFDGADQVFGLELCDRVTVQRTIPGGGTLSLTAFIQKIDVTGSNDQTPWHVTLGLSEGAAPAGG
jgi:hypothetical protein